MLFYVESVLQLCDKVLVKCLLGLKTWWGLVVGKVDKDGKDGGVAYIWNPKHLPAKWAYGGD